MRRCPAGGSGGGTRAPVGANFGGLAQRVDGAAAEEPEALTFGQRTEGGHEGCGPVGADNAGLNFLGMGVEVVIHGEFLPESAALAAA